MIYLGNIRQTHIKSVAIDLVKKYPEQFSGDFQNNKEKVDLLVTVSSNLLRNRIAGYITRSLSLAQHESSEVEEEEPVEE